MNKFKLLSVLTLFAWFSAFKPLIGLSQPPAKFHYQAIVRNNENQLIVNQIIKIEITIKNQTDTLYFEVFTPTTDAHGRVTIPIGETESLSGIDWNSHSLYLIARIDTAGGSDFQNFGSGILTDVPYAFHAGTADSLTRPLAETDPLFSASPASALVATDTIGLINKIQTLENIMVVNDIYTLTDIDGNIYNTTKIGNQIWMAENLKTMRYNNGILLYHCTNDAEWGTLTSSGYCWYANDPDYHNSFGILYNWFVIAEGNVCPTGWHVPNDNDWITLTNYLGGEANAGIKLKSTSSAYWSTTPVIIPADLTNFMARGGGVRNINGTYSALRTNGYWWTSTERTTGGAWAAYGRGMVHNTDAVINGHFDKNSGFAIRCIKD